MKVPVNGNFSFHYIKGIRDIFSGIIVTALLLTKEYRALGIILLCAFIVPATDMFIVYSRPDHEMSRLYPHLTAIIICLVFGVYYLRSKKKKIKIMVIFNIALLVHFTAFLLFLSKLILLFPREQRYTDKSGLLLGIVLLITGLLMVALKYPAINYYKVIPKTGIFLVISVLCAIYSGKVLPKPVYFTLLVLTVLASVIAVFRV
ncbi:DUF4267 domain-containing protein [Pedobacter sp. NJ-S-72]